MLPASPDKQACRSLLLFHTSQTQENHFSPHWMVVTHSLRARTRLNRGAFHGTKSWRQNNDTNTCFLLFDRNTFCRFRAKRAPPSFGGKICLYAFLKKWLHREHTWRLETEITKIHNLIPLSAATKWRPDHPVPRARDFFPRPVGLHHDPPLYSLPCPSTSAARRKGPPGSYHQQQRGSLSFGGISHTRRHP